MRLNVPTAEQLLDFDVLIGNAARAADQLEGAVALHNILDSQGVAYLADEVGMGKTYVALGVVALLRHFKPNARVLVIAPRANIQRKWQKELQLFVKHNVRVSDLRVRTPVGTPARPLVHCDRLVDLVRETTLDPDRDFFLRMSSFSLALGHDAASRGGFRDRLRAELPWVPPDLFDLRAAPDVLKDRFGQALNAALPVFDLVIIDEAHNLKHGLGPRVAARNRVLAAALGHSSVAYDSRLPNTGPRAGKVLLLSATPIDDDYAQLWNQLDVVDRGAAFRALRDPGADEAIKRETARRFLVRRVTDTQRRRGEADEEPLPARVAIGRCQRMGRAAAAGQRPGAPDGRARPEEGQRGARGRSLRGELPDRDARVVRVVSRDRGAHAVGGRRGGVARLELRRHRPVRRRARARGRRRQRAQRARAQYRRTFGTELPHPKMDALTERLSTSWIDGSKALVFVRRVRSVDELKARLDVAYDRWLLDRLRQSAARATSPRACQRREAVQGRQAAALPARQRRAHRPPTATAKTRATSTRSSPTSSAARDPRGSSAVHASTGAFSSAPARSRRSSPTTTSCGYSTRSPGPS